MPLSRYSNVRDPSILDPIGVEARHDKDRGGPIQVPLAGRGRTKSASVTRRPDGGEGNRTPGLLLAKQALSQLSYTPS